jgi:5-enolpyruvylshikimate-3-phosphate synthase
VKESDRVATVISLLAALGFAAAPRQDGLTVQGSGRGSRTGGTVDSVGDHRIAMAGAVAALASAADVNVSGWGAVATSYPGFAEEHARCT